MKIIAQISSDKYVAELSKNEIAMLAGYSSSYNDKFKEAFKGIGSEIEVAKLYHYLNKVAQLHKTLEKFHDNIRELNKTAMALAVIPDPFVELQKALYDEI